MLRKIVMDGMDIMDEMDKSMAFLCRALSAAQKVLGRKRLSRELIPATTDARFLINLELAVDAELHLATPKAAHRNGGFLRVLVVFGI
jgi:hypothetical protein